MTKKANITAIKNAGFNAIRIPVTWSKLAGGAPNYTIRKNWMERVTEVVNYAVENDMIILLNTHHDEDIFKFMDSNVEESLRAFRKIWEQIADNFKNYDEKLVFEGLNEPRTKGSEFEWSGGTAAERRNLEKHYQAFVEVVRASGGNNDKRILMVNPMLVSDFNPPVDTALHKIIVSYHSYSPIDFTFVEEDGLYLQRTWSENNPADTASIIREIDIAHNTFIVGKGIPVIIGEFGAVDKDNEADRAEWAEFFVKSALDKDIKCFYWDDGADFRLLNRSNNMWYFPQIVAALKRGAGN